jgi:hypothetical protein
MNDKSRDGCPSSRISPAEERREVAFSKNAMPAGATLTECSRERQIAATCAGKFVSMFRNHYRLGECRECGTDSVLRRRVPRHEVHLVLTILTMGFWGFCWIITIIAARWEPWRCRGCDRPQEEPRPEATRGHASAETAMGSAFGLVREHMK